MKREKLLITGGAGFIGSTFVKEVLQDGFTLPVVVDKLTYAGDLLRLQAVKGRYVFYKADIIDKQSLRSVFKKEKPHAVVHFAAESHVDRSIRDASTFIETNVRGTQVLADVAREYNVKRFIHISTDEVYGEIRKGGFPESHPLCPSSPYSAAKAAADLLVISYIRTHGFPAIIVRPSNIYGPWQYPEKLVPWAVLCLLKKQKIPVYGRGQNIREWLFVGDCVAGILDILKRGRAGEIYNLGSGEERKNMEVVQAILTQAHKGRSWIVFVKDRQGHDIRYRMDSRKIRKELGWKPSLDFEKGLKATVEWCLDNREWLLRKWRYIAPFYHRE
ncbi:MAG: dTDP-glucose 4,6-dehydratase [Candidatus Omnitrophota bacterium]|jgi:dTDP-glucose 4,6-dehydratase|nr:MAG: dTDP-glucose 4,6-dehydratase [Candidatus Omnitrophota bacterium]